MEKALKNISGLVAAITASLAVSNSIASPAVSSAKGTFSNGQVITISGTGFGGGPNVVLYDDFEKNAGANGQVIPLSSPEVGQWTQYGQDTGRPRYTSYANSGSHAWRISDPSTNLNSDNSNRLGQFLQLFSSSFQEFYISYEVAVPPGTTFPGASSVNSFPNESSWKMTWFFDGPTGYGGDGKADMCVPTQAGGGDFYFAGNDGVIQEFGSGTSWWSWKGFNRISAWLKADPSSPSTSGNVMFQTVNSEKGMKSTTLSKSVFPSGSSTQWNRMTMPGWWGNGDNTNNQATYDDVYVAVGPNSAARVEIGDAPTYAASKKLTVLTPTSWSSTQITATVRAGSFSSFDGAFIYVIDSNNNVSPAFPICASCAPASSPPPTSVPEPPTGLRVN